MRQSRRLGQGPISARGLTGIETTAPLAGPSSELAPPMCVPCGEHTGDGGLRETTDCREQMRGHVLLKPQPPAMLSDSRALIMFPPRLQESV